MDIILYFFRDKIAGTYYFIYAFICLMLMFSIIGYLYKQKYAKVEIKLNTSQPKKEEKVESSKNQDKVENSNQRINLFQKKQDNNTSVSVSNTSKTVATQGTTNLNSQLVKPVNPNQPVQPIANQSAPTPIIQPIPQTVNINQPVNPTVQVAPNSINKTVSPVNQNPAINQTQVVKPVVTQQTVNENIEIK